MSIQVRSSMVRVGSYVGPILLLIYYLQSYTRPSALFSQIRLKLHGSHKRARTAHSMCRNSRLSSCAGSPSSEHRSAGLRTCVFACRFSSLKLISPRQGVEKRCVGRQRLFCPMLSLTCVTVVLRRLYTKAISKLLRDRNSNCLDIAGLALRNA